MNQLQRLPRQDLTYADLFRFVEKKVNIHEDEHGELQCSCHGGTSRPFLHEFFELNAIDVKTRRRILRLLIETQGHCDCEIILNSTEGFPSLNLLSEENVKKRDATRTASILVTQQDAGTRALLLIIFLNLRDDTGFRRSRRVLARRIPD